MTRVPPPYVAEFAEIDLSHRPMVGGKGGSLAELTHIGIPVPHGFVVTTTAFDHFMHSLDPEQTISRRIASLDASDSLALEKECAEVRALIRNAPIPAGIGAAIAQSYEALQHKSGHNPVAIRSSATAEDSDEASFAGQQDTFLWVRGLDAAVDAIRNCWASLYNAEAVSYRLRLNLNEAEMAMAVVVQAMVDSLCSGVLFTRSPTSGDKSVIAIEAAWGLGSAIVSGEVTPDKYIINKITGEIVDRKIATKTVEHLPHEKQNGIIEMPLPADRQTLPCLTDEMIQELVVIARKVERHYGCPQDMEWALDRRLSFPQNIFLLQSRPETVWSRKPAPPVALPDADPMAYLLNTLTGGFTKP